jgi:hypothetical protein
VTLLFRHAISNFFCQWYTKNGQPVADFTASIVLSAVGLSFNVIANGLLYVQIQRNLQCVDPIQVVSFFLFGEMVENLYKALCYLLVHKGLKQCISIQTQTHFTTS